MPPRAEVSYHTAMQQDQHDALRPLPLMVRPSPTRLRPSALALHLDCSRAYIGKLEAEGVIQRQGDGFPLDQSRVSYLRFLRRERQRSPRALQIDPGFPKALVGLAATLAVEVNY